MNSNLEAIFQAAADHLTTIASSLDQETLLYLYSHYKQSTIGTCKTPKPGYFDFQGKQKWNAWKELGNKSKNEAMEEYILKIQEIDPFWKPDNDTEVKNTSSFGGPVVSTLMNNFDSKLSDDEKTIFDWVKECEINQLEKLKANCDLNMKDEQGMASLHWACDRGHKSIVEWLIKNQAYVNIKDDEKQTPLHYASSCGYAEIVKLLLQSNADKDIEDTEGLKPVDIAANVEIAQILRSKAH